MLSRLRARLRCFGSVARTGTGTYCLAAPILTAPPEVQTRNVAGVAVDNVDFTVWVP
jgi:hypothetical protein